MSDDAQLVDANEQREYAKVSKLGVNGGMASTAAAMVLAVVSSFTSYDFEFLAIMVAFAAVIFFLLANYCVTVATRGGASE